MSRKSFDVLDNNTDNHSVMREILKIVVEMKMPHITRMLRESMFELGGYRTMKVGRRGCII